MIITDIQIDHLSGTGVEDTKARGEVALISASACIRVQCDVPSYLSASQAVIRGRLVREAVRQARRLPEFRAGRTDLSFAPGLLA